MSADASALPPLADDAAHLLIVDDDTRIRELLSRVMMKNGYRVTTAADTAEARTALKNLAFDLIVLDVMMPGENGLDFVAALRAGATGLSAPDVPVLMLTARAEPSDRVSGLERGVDDYLTKPFDPRELVLRIASILRRARPPSPLAPIEIVRFGAYTYDLMRGELTIDGDIIRLTDREREMLKMLAEKPGETVSREALGGVGFAANERTVDVQVNRLRRKIELDPANPRHLQTVRGLGYRLLTDK
ncbi:response regulator [Methylovirgula sp. 4M-Z18]|uniref:response regulator n=1 Tax=Methylovirgula sp. 4M-Z18 TaxID=2293567 RepID=UPI000E2F6AB6|nr:response regulator transcription factor [Methylovirgula sp. 4M-Z18]RFB79676.1 DNA-binding response regulator [Methylovirgula sp. 4M-Z18]